MKYKILSLGTMYLDINCLEFPYEGGLKPNQEVVGDEYEVVPGGSALNFARICAALDLKPVFIGKAGNDKMGQVLQEIIAKTGVEPALIKSSQVSTALGINFIGADGSSIMAVVGSANRSLNYDEVEKKIEEYLDNVEYLYLGGIFKLKSLLPHYEELVRKAQAKGVKVVLDHGRVSSVVSKEEIEIVQDLVKLVDYYLPSKDELLAVWEANNIQEAVRKIRVVSKTIIIVKDSINGVIGVENGNELINVPSFKVEVVNSVGAGDTFNAGFIKAQNMNMGFKESIRFACAVAALKISTKELPTLEKVENFVNNKNKII